MSAVNPKGVVEWVSKNTPATRALHIASAVSPVSPTASGQSQTIMTTTPAKRKTRRSTAGSPR